MNNLNILIPMAGEGSRFIKAGVHDPKPLIKVNNKYLIEHSINSLNIKAQYIFITKKYKNEEHNLQLSKTLKSLAPDSIEITLDTSTTGATETVLYAKKYIDNENPLIITNCDQLINWSSKDFFNFIKNNICDGAVVLFKSNDNKNSFAEIQDGIVTKIVEKNNISNNALVGLHYWQYGKDFVASAENLLNSFRKNGSPECYISETYNYLIKNNKKILPYFLQKNGYISLGTPEDISKYNGKIKEYYTDKPKTIFCDIDGTILKHSYGFSNVIKIAPEILEGVIEKFNDWDSKGHKIILTTARKESARKITERHLQDLGLCWDILLMNMTSGQRFIINDKLAVEDQDRAIAINLITDSGFDIIDWEDYDL